MFVSSILYFSITKLNYVKAILLKLSLPIVHINTEQRIVKKYKAIILLGNVNTVKDTCSSASQINTF